MEQVWEKGIHPDYHPVVYVDVGADFEFVSQSTMTSEEVREIDGVDHYVIRLEISSASHPFYTGKQHFVILPGASRSSASVSAIGVAPPRRPRPTRTRYRIMAKTSKIARNEHRKRQVEKYAERRTELLEIIKDPKVSEDSRDEAYRALRRLPRDSSPTRIRNRCNVTGRPRGYYRKFGLSRIALRDLALRGDLPGVTKSSW